MTSLCVVELSFGSVSRSARCVQYSAFVLVGINVMLWIRTPAPSSWFHGKPMVGISSHGPSTDSMISLPSWCDQCDNSHCSHRSPKEPSDVSSTGTGSFEAQTGLQTTSRVPFWPAALKQNKRGFHSHSASRSVSHRAERKKEEARRWRRGAGRHSPSAGANGTGFGLVASPKTSKHPWNSL